MVVCLIGGGCPRCVGGFLRGWFVCLALFIEFLYGARRKGNTHFDGLFGEVVGARSDVDVLFAWVWGRLFGFSRFFCLSRVLDAFAHAPVQEGFPAREEFFQRDAFFNVVHVAGETLAWCYVGVDGYIHQLCRAVVDEAGHISEVVVVNLATCGEQFACSVFSPKWLPSAKNDRAYEV